MFGLWSRTGFSVGKIWDNAPEEKQNLEQSNLNESSLYHLSAVRLWTLASLIKESYSIYLIIITMEIDGN